MESTQLLVPFVPLLSVIVAAIAAYFSYRSAKASLFAHEAKLLREFSVDYAKSEFLDHLRTLRSWLETHGPDSGHTFIEMLTAEDSTAISVDRARRAVKFHFEDAAKLGRSKYLRKAAVRQICEQAGIDLYFEVAIPLTIALNPALDLSSHNYLQRMGFAKHQKMVRIR